MKNKKLSKGELDAAIQAGGSEFTLTSASALGTSPHGLSVEPPLREVLAAAYLSSLLCKSLLCHWKKTTCKKEGRTTDFGVM